jgi:hypothetical protein
VGITYGIRHLLYITPTFEFDNALLVVIAKHRLKRFTIPRIQSAMNCHFLARGVQKISI